MGEVQHADHFGFTALAKLLGHFDVAGLHAYGLHLVIHTHLDSGFAALEAADVAMGPTPDGGYYLIGMKQPHKALFRVDGNGSASVYENTVSAAEKAGLTVAAAMACGDVDTPEDLQLLAANVDPASHTGRYLAKLKQDGVAL